MKWALTASGVLLVAATVGGFLFLKSNSFQTFAMRTIVSATNDATGGRAEIRHFDFQLSTLTVHLYNITIHGTESATRPPLLQIDKLTVGVTIQSLLRRKFTVKELLIEHPVVNVRIDRAGKSNIPQPSQIQSGSTTSVIDLAARHVSLRDGELNYNDTTIPLDAEVYGLNTEVHFDVLARRYSGAISYENGRLRYAGQAAWSHSLNAKFIASNTLFSLESAVLKVGASALSLRADITNYIHPTIEGSYDLRIHTQDFSAMLAPVTPAGDVSFSGRIHYQGGNNLPLVRSVSIEGQVASEELVALSSEGRLDLHQIQGQYQLVNGAFQAHEVRFELLGGKIVGDIGIQHLDTVAAFRVHATLKGVSLQAAQQAVRRSELKRIDLLGRLNGTVEALWTRGISNIRAHTDLSLSAAAYRGTILPSRSVPVDGSIHASYDGPRNIITFHLTTLRIPSTTIALQGEAGNHSNLEIQADSSDLHRLAILVSALRSSPPAPIEVSGLASLKAAVHGSIKNPILAGQFSAQNLLLQGSQWTTAKFSVQASSSQITLQDAVLVSKHQGKASLSAKVALQNWSYLPSSQVAVTLAVQRMSVADLQRVANLHYPVSGDLSADVSLHGSQLNPAGSGSASISHARAYGQPIQRLAATFRGDKGSITSTLDVTTPAGSAHGSGSYTPKTQAYSVQLNASSVALQELQIVRDKNLGIAGTLTVSATGVGTLDNPQFTALVEVPQLQLRNNSISQVKGNVQVANHHAELTLNSQVARASVRSNARIDLSGGYYTEATIDTTGVPLNPLLAMYLPSLPQGFQGETELHATLKGPLKDTSQIEAHLTIPTLKASYQSLEIGSASPIRADYSHSVVTLQPVEIRGTGTSLRVQGTIPLAGSTAPSLTAKGSVDMGILRIFAPDLQSSGSLSLDIHASGTAKNPIVQGQVHLQDVAVSTPTAPLGVENLNGTLDIQNDRLQISSLAGQVGGGQMSLGGFISYRPDLQFNVLLQSTSVRLRYPDGIRAVLDGNLVLRGTREASTLTGRVLIDSLSFTPDFDLAKFTDQFSGSTTPAESSLADNMALSVGVHSKDNLSASSSQLSVEGQVNLQVTGTAANPIVTGRTDLTSGELFYRNVRYQLQRGIISFENPNETEPVMNVSATATVEQYNLTLTMRGTFDKLTTSYSSDPPLATADVINLIARGKTTQEAAAAGQTTDSMIASQVASQFTGGIQQLAGISSLQIDPLLSGNNQNPSARVAIQQRVTKNFLFTFSTDLSQPGTEVVQGDYKFNQRWSLSVTRDEVGGISVDGKYHTKF